MQVSWFEREVAAGEGSGLENADPLLWNYHNFEIKGL